MLCSARALITRKQTRSSRTHTRLAVTQSTARPPVGGARCACVNSGDGRKQYEAGRRRKYLTVAERALLHACEDLQDICMESGMNYQVSEDFCRTCVLCADRLYHHYLCLSQIEKEEEEEEKE